jgi:hypothetical protein
MTRDDKQQRELPYGAAQGSFDERRLKVGMTIGAMYDPETEALRDCYTGAPVMELRVLLLLMLDEEARGRLLTSEEMTKPPWGVLCSERTIRRVLKFGHDLGILQSVRRLEANQQKFIKAWQIDWAGINRFIRAQAVGQIGKTPGQSDQSPGQIGQTSGQFGQPRTSSSFSYLSSKDVDDVVLRNKASTKSEQQRPDWPNEPRETTGHDRRDSGEPKSVNATPHGEPSALGLVSEAPRRAVNQDLAALVGLVRQCGVLAALKAVQTAIGHGHDVLAEIAGWRQFCRPGCDPDFAAKRLYYRLCDPSMGFEPHQGWVVQYPSRIRSKEEIELEEAKLRAEAAAKARDAQDAADLENLKQWALALPEVERQSLLEEFFVAPENKAAERTVRKAERPMENGLFLLWLSRRKGGSRHA